MVERRRLGVAVEGALPGHERGALLLEHLEDGLVLHLGAPGPRGVGERALAKDRVQLVVVGDPRTGLEVVLPRGLHLVLDLTLLPARRRRAGGRLDEVMRAHALEAAVEAPVPARRDRVHRRRHVVVDPARAGAAEEGEGAVMGVEDHLLGLAGVGDPEAHPAVAEPDMRHLHLGRDAAHHDPFVAPVELEGLAGREGQRHEGLGDAAMATAPPALRVTPDRVVAALVALPAQVVEDPRQPEAVPLRALLVGLQHRLEPRDEGAELRQRRLGPLVLEPGLPGAQDLAHRVPADPPLPADLLDALAVHKVVPPDLRHRLQRNHPRSRPDLPPRRSKPLHNRREGPILDADHPA